MIKSLIDVLARLTTMASSEMTNQTVLHGLDELCHIFDWLSPRQVLGLERVNKTWQAAVHQWLATVDSLALPDYGPLLAKKLTCLDSHLSIGLPDELFCKRKEEEEKINAQYLHPLVAKCSNIRRVSCQLEMFTPEDLDYLISNCPNIDSFEFCWPEASFTEDQWQKLLELVHHRLTHLTVRFPYHETFLPIVTFKELEELLAGATLLKTVNIFVNKRTCYVLKAINTLDPSVFVSAHLRDTIDTPQELSQAITSRVDDLTIDFCAVLQQPSVVNFQRLKKLRILDFYSYVYSGTVEFPCLKKLTLERLDNRVSNLNSVFNQLDQLEELKVSFKDNIGGDALLRLLKKVPNLTRLAMDQPLGLNYLDVYRLLQLVNTCCRKLAAVELYSIRLKQWSGIDDPNNQLTQWRVDNVLRALDMLEQMPKVRSVFVEVLINDLNLQLGQLITASAVEQLVDEIASFGVDKQNAKAQLLFQVKTDQCLQLVNQIISAKQLPNNIKVTGKNRNRLFD